jgi:hypothetical protein
MGCGEFCGFAVSFCCKLGKLLAKSSRVDMLQVGLIIRMCVNVKTRIVAVVRLWGSVADVHSISDL